LARAGTLFQRKPLRELRESLNSETYGGAALLGLNGTVVLAHGSSHAKGVARACRLAHDLAGGPITEQIRRRVHTRSTHWLPRRAQSDARGPLPQHSPSPTDRYAANMADPQEILSRRVQSALGAAFGPEFADTDPVIRPSQFADYQANAALALAKRLG